MSDRIDSGPVKSAIDALVWDAFNKGVRRGVEMSARVAKDRAEQSMLLGNDRMRWERDVALYIQKRIERIIASHEADPDRATSSRSTEEK